MRSGILQKILQRPHIRSCVLAAFTLCLLDQLVKFLAVSYLTYGVAYPVIPGFNLTLLHNTGAAFSLLDDQSGWQRWFFSCITISVSVGIVFWIASISASERWALSALSLILGGALGNLTDRISLGYVVDFIQIYYGQWFWPAFNVADAAICVGAVMLLIRGPLPRQAQQGRGSV